jgi:hypothetical protein
MDTITRNDCKQILLSWNIPVDVLPQLMSYVYSNIDHLDVLIRRHPEIDWNWGQLSQSPVIPLTFIEKYIDKSWDWSCLSWNPNITCEFVERYIVKP